MAALRKSETQFHPTPTPAEAGERIAEGRCPVCDVKVSGCWCRFCPANGAPGCDRYWIAMKSALRKKGDDSGAPPYGIREEICPSCFARARAL